MRRRQAGSHPANNKFLEHLDIDSIWDYRLIMRNRAVLRGKHLLNEGIRVWLIPSTANEQTGEL